MTTYNRVNKDRAFRRTPGRVHHRRFEEETTTPSALGTQGREMDRYRWNILRIEMEELWRNNNRGRTQGFLHGAGFLVHTVVGCRPASSRLITIRLSTSPYVQAYAPTSEYDDNKIEEFYDQLQNVIDQTPKKDLLVVQGDLECKSGHLWTLLQ